MSDQDWLRAAHERAMEIVEREGVMNELGCIFVDRSHTEGRPGFGLKRKKITISQAIAMPGKGLHTRHLCHEEACVNPNHLVVGTPSEKAAARRKAAAYAGGPEEIALAAAERQAKDLIGLFLVAVAGLADQVSAITPSSKPTTGSNRETYTPPQLAKKLGIGEDKVRSWIRDGSLKAPDVSKKRGGPPRYLITQDAVDAFLKNRQVEQPVAAPRKQRKSGDDDGVTKYF
jgi:excisionase family DNA binding protein